MTMNDYEVPAIGLSEAATAIMAAIGQATKHGVIIKSGEALEKMGKVDTIAFDKTGTLTFGRLEVSDVIPFIPALTENGLLAMTASAEVRAELLPEEKMGNIVRLQDTGKMVCMIDDGVNDASSLKTASVGIAMGSIGSDIAIEAADVALMSDDISKIPYLKRLSNATVKTIKVSIALSMCINFVAIVLSLLEVLTLTIGTARGLTLQTGSCQTVSAFAKTID